MGRLVDGKWIKGSVLTTNQSGEYDRIPRSFLDKIDTKHPIYQPEENRYHLYVSYACPWAHRTLIYRQLKKLESVISVSVVHPDMLDMGWSFDSNFEGATGDTLYNNDHLKDIYIKAQSDVSTSVTVPVLWDKKTKSIVNNESSEIIRLFNTAFNTLTGDFTDYYPKEHQADIDQWNEKIYESVNNGVYRCGFAKTQKAYDKAVNQLFDRLDQLDEHLMNHDYLVANQLTEADIRLFPTLVRFDPVYYIHFKCAKRKISEYKQLSQYLQRCLKQEAFRSTTHLNHIIRHYYYSHESINPYRIIPAVSSTL